MSARKGILLVSVCLRELDARGRHGECRQLFFEPDEVAQRKLARFTCDQHNRPIMLAPAGAQANAAR